MESKKARLNGFASTLSGFKAKKKGAYCQEAKNKWLCNSNEVINMKLIQEEDEIFSEEGYFHPFFTNQIFNDKEQISGYLGLNIDIYFTATTLRPYINLHFESVEDTADDLGKPFRNVFKNGYTTRYEEFQRWVQEDLFQKPVGEIIKEFGRKDPKGETENFVIYKTRANHKDFKQTYINFQSMLMFFIDGLSFIELDPNWHYYILYKRGISPTIQEVTHSIVGFATTYNFRKGMNFRTRISQFLILPHCQRQGFGTELLDGIYMDLLHEKRCFEITVEDPSNEFECMRDIYDIKLIIKNGFFSSFRPDKKDLVKDKITIENYSQYCLSKSEIDKIHSTLKLTKSRVVRCFELIKFAKLDSSDRLAFDKFRKEIKEKTSLLAKDFEEIDPKSEKSMKKAVKGPHIYLGSKIKKSLMKALGLS